jgi:hypothetical protein
MNSRLAVAAYRENRAGMCGVCFKAQVPVTTRGRLFVHSTPVSVSPLLILYGRCRGSGGIPIASPDSGSPTSSVGGER